MTKKFQQRSGFTLVETVLAIGVVGVLLAVFVAMFYPARTIVQAALTVQEADRVVNALTNELEVVRKPERATSGARISTANRYVSSFDKAFYWMRNTATPATTILIYSYRGDLSKPLRDDGTFAVLENNTYVPGQDSVLITTACLATNQDRWEDLKYSEGPIFAVKMTQFVISPDTQRMKYVLAPKHAGIHHPYNPKTEFRKPEDYVYDPNNKQYPAWGAEVIYMAEFYQVHSRDPRSLRNLTWEQFKKPVFSRNLVFRR